jgi:hypothetical protein
MIFNEAFENTDNDLDKMARDLNNKKNGFYNNVKKANKSFEMDTIRGIEAFANEPGFQFSPQAQFYDEKSRKYKGDFSSGLPTPLEKNGMSEDEFSENSRNSKNSGYSSYNSGNNDSFSLGKKRGSSYSDNSNNSEHFISSFDNIDNIDNIDSNDMMSEYSFLPKKKKKHLRLNTKHLQEYSENDDQLILEHIKNCNECKKHLLNLLKNENHFISQKNIQNIPNIPNVIDKDENSLFGKINYKEMKEVIILIIIGIIIIFILDIFLRR